jgi:tRNA threonylcarbamoyladenosine biosynthesis protein TsaB
MDDFSYILAMDTSTRSLTVALLRNHECIAEAGLEAERNHSLYLVPVIQQMMAEQGLSLKQIQAIAVGVGPGSYTGVRIGVTVAKTMAWSLNIPVYGVSSLSAYAHAARASLDLAEDTHYLPLLDARRTQIYTALFRDRAGLWERMADDCITLASDWFTQIESILLKDEAKRLVIIGDTAPFTAEIAQCSERTVIPTDILHLPLSAYHVGLLARARLLSGETDDLHELVPNYTQLAEAEAKLLAATKNAQALGGSANESANRTVQGATADVSSDDSR